MISRRIQSFFTSAAVVKLVVLLVIGLVSVSAITALEIDRAELQDIGDADIEFESYEGPVEQFDSGEAIRGIGTFLGGAVGKTGAAQYTGRYRIRRIIGNPEEPLRAADILELDSTARVDHITNLRRIIAGYLESAWDYRRDDADLLARFITIYNAVHRGNMDFFAARYRTAVHAVLRPDAVGLATSYRQWPGKTQIVIPIRDDRAAGDLDAIDPRQLIDRDVITELRSRADLGIADRKAIIAFIERVIEERTEVIAEERADIEREQAEIDRQRQEIAAAESAPPEESIPDKPAPDKPTPDEPGAEKPTPEKPTPEKPTPEKPSPEVTPSKDETSVATEEDLDRRQQVLEERRDKVEQEEQELQELTKEVEELYQETADDQAVVDAGVDRRVRLPFVIAGRGGGGRESSFELAVIDLETLEPVGIQTIPVAARDVVRYQGALLVAHSGNGRLLLLDETSLELLQESEITVVPGARILVVNQSVLTVIEEKGRYYIGQFDPRLVLERRSAAAVRPDTDIAGRGDDLVVQGDDGTLRRLDMQEFR